jgi:hypothetical protein
MLYVHVVAFFSMLNIMGPLNATQCKSCGKKCFNVKASNAIFILVQYRKGNDICCPKQGKVEQPNYANLIDAS